MVPRLPAMPPPQRLPDTMYGTMSRKAYWEWRAMLAENNAAYQREHPEWIPPPVTEPEPPPTLWERLFGQKD